MRPRESKEVDKEIAPESAYPGDARRADLGKTKFVGSGEAGKDYHERPGADRIACGREGTIARRIRAHQTYPLDLGSLSSGAEGVRTGVDEVRGASAWIRDLVAHKGLQARAILPERQLLLGIQERPINSLRGRKWVLRARFSSSSLLGRHRQGVGRPVERAGGGEPAWSEWLQRRSTITTSCPRPRAPCATKRRYCRVLR